MKTAWVFAASLFLNAASSWAQGLVGYAYYAPAPVVVVPSPTVIQTTYVPVPVVTYTAPVYAPTVVPAPIVAVAAPIMHSPYSVAARENVWANRYGTNLTYREYGPLGAQRYHYSVHSRPYGYVVRERGY